MTIVPPNMNLHVACAGALVVADLPFKVKKRSDTERFQLPRNYTVWWNLEPQAPAEREFHSFMLIQCIIIFVASLIWKDKANGRVCLCHTGLGCNYGACRWRPSSVFVLRHLWLAIAVSPLKCFAIKSCIARISTKFNCDMQVLPLNGE